MEVFFKLNISEPGTAGMLCLPAEERSKDMQHDLQPECEAYTLQLNTQPSVCRLAKPTVRPLSSSSMLN